MLTKLREARDEEGFTLIELLVVVIIIGILAAIAIPVFLNQRESAWRSAAESDARNAAIAVETYYTQEDAYPTTTAFPATTGAGTVDLDGDGTADVTVSQRVTLTYALVGTTGYTITASHADIAGETVVYNSTTGGLGDWS